MVCYAMKANSNQAVIATLARLGAGADVVSEGELRRALAAGVPARAHRLLRRRQDGARDGFRA
jgi:diaminopimelate decarboxylase